MPLAPVAVAMLTCQETAPFILLYFVKHIQYLNFMHLKEAPVSLLGHYGSKPPDHRNFCFQLSHQEFFFGTTIISDSYDPFFWAVLKVAIENKIYILPLLRADNRWGVILVFVFSRTSLLSFVVFVSSLPSFRVHISSLLSFATECIFENDVDLEWMLSSLWLSEPDCKIRKRSPRYSSLIHLTFHCPHNLKIP